MDSVVPKIVPKILVGSFRSSADSRIISDSTIGVHDIARRDVRASSRASTARDDGAALTTFRAETELRRTREAICSAGSTPG